MLDILKLTVGIVILCGLILAIPVFAYVLGAGLALVVLFYFMKEFNEAEQHGQTEKRTGSGKRTP
jgi:hypothetical protein